MKQLPLIAVLLFVLAGLLAYQFWPESSPETSTYVYELPESSLNYDDGEVTFYYPEQPPAMYMRAIDWPPIVTKAEIYSCEPGETEVGRETEGNANGQRYCVTTHAEGAAGSTYTDYRYVFDRAQPFVITFSMKTVQCANYNEPEQSACEEERTEYQIDSLALSIAETVVFK